MKVKLSLATVLVTLGILAPFMTAFAQDTHTVYVTTGNKIWKYGYPSWTDLGVFLTLPDGENFDGSTVPAHAMGIDYYNGYLYVGDGSCEYYGGNGKSRMHKIALNGNIAHTQSLYYNWGTDTYFQPRFIRIGKGGAIDGQVRVYANGIVFDGAGGWYLPHLTAYKLSDMTMDTRTSGSDPYNPVGSAMRVNCWSNSGGLIVDDNKIAVSIGYYNLTVQTWTGDLFYGNGTPGVWDGACYPTSFYNRACGIEPAIGQILYYDSTNNWAQRMQSLAVDQSGDVILGVGDWDGTQVNSEGLAKIRQTVTGDYTVVGAVGPVPQPMGILYNLGMRVGPDGNIYLLENNIGIRKFLADGTDQLWVAYEPNPGATSYGLWDLVFVPNETEAIVSGTVVYDQTNCNPNLPGKPYKYKVGSEPVQTGIVGPGGEINFLTTQTGSVDICIKVEGALSKKVTINISGPTASLGTVAVIAPDINNDDVWDDFDLNEVNGGFGNIVTPGTGADYNCDGVYDDFDLNQINGGFGSTGDCYGSW